MTIPTINSTATISVRTIQQPATAAMAARKPMLGRNCRVGIASEVIVMLGDDVVMFDDSVVVFNDNVVALGMSVVLEDKVVLREPLHVPT